MDTVAILKNAIFVMFGHFLRRLPGLLFLLI